MVNFSSGLSSYPNFAQIAARASCSRCALKSGSAQACAITWGQMVCQRLALAHILASACSPGFMRSISLSSEGMLFGPSGISFLLAVLMFLLIGFFAHPLDKVHVRA